MGEQNWRRKTIRLKTTQAQGIVVEVVQWKQYRTLALWPRMPEPTPAAVRRGGGPAPSNCRLALKATSAGDRGRKEICVRWQVLYLLISP